MSRRVIYPNDFGVRLFESVCYGIRPTAHRYMLWPVNRRQSRLTTVPMDKVTVIDLFSGAGGLGVAARNAGAAVGLSIEIDATCCETLRLNKRWHRGEVLEADLSEIKGKLLRSRMGLS